MKKWYLTYKGKIISITGFLIWNCGGQKKAVQPYSNDKRKILSTQNPISSENFLHEQGKEKLDKYNTFLFFLGVF